MEKSKAKKLARSRDCSCVLGKNRDNNYNEVIDMIYKDFKKEKKAIIKNIIHQYKISMLR